MLKTLIIEDNALFRQATKDMLLSKFPNMTITEAANEEEALKEVNRDCPEIILMDIRLPGRNGLDLTKEIKAQHPDVHVIILTSYDFQEYIEAATECGAEYYFVKGTAEPDKILASIDSMLQKSDDG